MLKEIVKISNVVTPGHQRKHVFLASVCFFSLGFPSKLCLISQFSGSTLFPQAKGKKRPLFFFVEIYRKNKGGMTVETLTIVFLFTDGLVLNFPGRQRGKSVNGTEVRPGKQGTLNIMLWTVFPHPSTWPAWTLGSPSSGLTSAANSCVTPPRCIGFLLYKVVVKAWKGQVHKGREDLIYLFIYFINHTFRFAVE